MPVAGAQWYWHFRKRLECIANSPPSPNCSLALTSSTLLCYRAQPHNLHPLTLSPSLPLTAVGAAGCRATAWEVNWRCCVMNLRCRVQYLLFSAHCGCDCRARVVGLWDGCAGRRVGAWREVQRHRLSYLLRPCRRFSTLRLLPFPAICFSTRRF